MKSGYLYAAFWGFTTVGAIVSIYFYGQHNPAGLVLWAVGVGCLVASRRMEKRNKTGGAMNYGHD
jgi:hypothetical protein